MLRIGIAAPLVEATPLFYWNANPMRSFPTYHSRVFYRELHSVVLAGMDLAWREYIEIPNETVKIQRKNAVIGDVFRIVASGSLRPDALLPCNIRPQAIKCTISGHVFAKSPSKFGTNGWCLASAAQYKFHPNDWLSSFSDQLNWGITGEYDWQFGANLDP
jgi:hypothetical protein